MNVEYVQHSPQTSASPGPLPPGGPEEMVTPPPRQRLWLRSLTSRLVVGVVALVIVLVAAIGSGTLYALRSFLDNRLDQQLESTATEGSVDHLFNGEVEYGPAPQAVWAVALDAQTGAQVFPRHASGAVLRMHLTLAQRRNIANMQSDSPMTVETTDGQTLRITTRPGQISSPTTGDQPATLVVGLSTSEVHRTLGRLVILELLIGGVAVLIALGATSLGVRRSLRNLYQVTGTAREVAAELSPEGAGLDRRVPVTEEGTEVGQLAESMNTLLAAVEMQFAARLESEHRLRQFLADASHELRTPLTSIRGYAELARMQRAAGDSQYDNLDRIESEGTRMSRLVDDLLMLARGDADDDNRADVHEPIDIADLLDDAVSGSRAAFPDRPIDLEIAAVPVVLGDRDQLLRAVRNLITNAAVHSEAGRPIRVHGFTDAGGAVVTVADGGPGLPPEQAAHVFERFWRADKARTRARGGTGLGLSIVAAIVRAHGGGVRFDSAVESGSTVTMWLPAASE